MSDISSQKKIKHDSWYKDLCEAASSGFTLTSWCLEHKVTPRNFMKRRQILAQEGYKIPEFSKSRKKQTKEIADCGTEDACAFVAIPVEHFNNVQTADFEPHQPAVTIHSGKLIIEIANTASHSTISSVIQSLLPTC